MRRKQWLKPPKKSFFLFCEWETEICYFNELKWFFSLNIRKIEKIKTISWWNKNKVEFSKNSIYLKTWYNKRDFKETKSKIFILIDLDRYSKQEIDFIKTSFEDENIIVITSNYDFEIWILLHFTLYKKENNNYIDEINKFNWGNYKKWENNCNVKIFRLIIENNLKNAISNANELESFNKSQWKENLKEMLPYTEVYKIFDYLF